jgi:2-succinyl-6-hydroxy-2,4-cyclohexadiene-1-carboxylate synthase
MGSSSDWQNISENLSSDYYCMAIDLPGHGKSEIDNTENSYSIKRTAKYIIDFLQNNNTASCDFIGYSMGGRLAIYLAIKYPNYFNKIIIESAQPGILDLIERRNRKKLDHELSRKLEIMGLSEFLEFWYNQPIFATLKNHKSFANLVNSRIKNDPRKLSKSLVEMGTGAQPSLWKDLIKITSPCLLIAGEFDLKYQKIFSKMHKEIYSSNFVIIKNCGHNTHFENPDEFIKVVKKFLNN